MSRYSMILADETDLGDSPQGRLWGLGQLENPDSVVFWVPSICAERRVIAAGDVGTASDAAGSRAVSRLFRAAIRATMERREEAFVGPGARARAMAGWRLTLDVDSPRAFDVSV